MDIPLHPARRTLACLFAVAVLASCAAPAPTPPADSKADTTMAVPQRYRDLPPEAVFEINDSSLTLKVYRAGRLKQFGHNHVITSTAVRGSIHLPEREQDVTAGFADLSLPVASLIVDDPEDRARAGEPFGKAIPDADRHGTRGNLLGPRVLDALNHPRITIAVSPLSKSEAHLQISFKGAPYGVIAPVRWTRTGGALSASSDFTLAHADLGLTPFAILGGAIAVADDIQVSLRLSAVLTTLSQAAE